MYMRYYWYDIYRCLRRVLQRGWDCIIIYSPLGWQITGDFLGYLPPAHIIIYKPRDDVILLLLLLSRRRSYNEKYTPTGGKNGRIEDTVDSIGRITSVDNFIIISSVFHTLYILGGFSILPWGVEITHR